MLYNLVRVYTNTTGQDDLILGSAVSGFLTFAEANVQNGGTVSYGIKDGNYSEVGTGVYTSSTSTLTRNVLASNDGGDKLFLSGTAEVFITILAQDIPTTTASLSDSSNKRFVTDAQLTVIGNTSGTNTGDQNLSGYFLKSTDDLDDITAGTTNLHFTDTLKNKLDGIATGAEVNVNADWNAVSGDALILNKPTIPSTFDNLTDGVTNVAFTTTLKSKLDGIAAGAEVNVNADWNSSSGDSQILNKPTVYTQPQIMARMLGC
jgi:Cu/Ag efflux protein CusF